MTARRLALDGAVLAALSLGLPWASVAGTPGYVTIGYYSSGYCDLEYCYSGTYEPGVYVPGTPSATYAGAMTDARFFIVAGLALAVVGGLWLRRRRTLRWAAYAGLAGVALGLPYGLTGGDLALLAAAGCWWWAGRKHGGSPAPGAEDPPARSALSTA